MFSDQTQPALDCRVLVLNRHYMALRIISVRRAFSLLFSNHAEVIACDDGSYANYNYESWKEISEYRRAFEAHKHDWISTVQFDLVIPRVIRVLSYNRIPNKKVKFNRRNLFARDKNHCQYCGKRFPMSELSLDHVVPRRLGGITSWGNIVCACLKCNVKKGGRTPAQAHMKLIKKPARPARNPVVHIHLNHERYKSWKQFLDNAYWSVELT